MKLLNRLGIAWRAERLKCRTDIELFLLPSLVEPIGTICTGFLRPTRSGPISVEPPSTRRSLVEIDAAWIAGITSTFAVSVRRQKG